MAFVLDASVTMAWCFLDEATEHTDSLRDSLSGTTAHVPVIWRLEVAKVLLGAERRKRIKPADSGRFLQFLDALPISVDPQSVDEPPAQLLQVARQHDLSVYDASYLQVAIRRGLPIATRDARLKAAGEKAGVPLL